MRFDSRLFYHVGDPYPWEALFDEMHETVEPVDELGFTGLWLAEHHFAWDGWYRSGSNPLLLGVDCARYSDRCDRDLNRALYAENVDILLTTLTQEAWIHEGQFHTFPAPGWKEANPMAHDERFHGIAFRDRSPLNS